MRTRCDEAWAAPVQEGTVAPPLIAMWSAGQEAHKPEEELTLPFLEPGPQETAQTLVCVAEADVTVGQYMGDGGRAVRYDWAARLVRLSDGQVLKAAEFKGSAPPAEIKVETGRRGGGASGSRPRADFLNWLARTVNVPLLMAHGGDANVVFSPNGAMLASADSEGKVRILDLASGMAQEFGRDHSRAGGGLAFSPTHPV
jgi:WD40 repeat protein